MPFQDPCLPLLLRFLHPRVFVRRSPLDWMWEQVEHGGMLGRGEEGEGRGSGGQCFQQRHKESLQRTGVLRVSAVDAIVAAVVADACFIVGVGV